MVGIGAIAEMPTTVAFGNYDVIDPLAKVMLTD
jgi:hypothetical protein